MKNLNELNVINAEANLEHGFFWVEFEGGKSLQCCLKAVFDEDGNHAGYSEQIDANDSGYDWGLCWDNNQWAAGEDGEAGHIKEFLIEQAIRAGVEII